MFIYIYLLIYLYSVFYASTQIVEELLNSNLELSIDSNLELNTRITRVTWRSRNMY